MLYSPAHWHIMNPQAVISPDGVAAGISAGKGYVDMSTVDETTSQQIADIITSKGGRFLEAPVSGSKKPAIDGQLIILAAGDEGLFKDSAVAFDIMAKRSLYLGEVGAAARMKLVVNMVMGTMMGERQHGVSALSAAAAAVAKPRGDIQHEMMPTVTMDVIKPI